METKEEALQASWEVCLKEIEMSVSAADYNKWFAPLRAQSYEDSVLTVFVPSAYYKENIEQHFGAQMKAGLNKAFGLGRWKLRFWIPTANDAQQMDGRLNTNVQRLPIWRQPNDNDTNLYVGVAIKSPMVDPQLNEAFTFDTYVIGESNKMAASVAEAVASAPGRTAFNPLFIFGGPGVGKTHLIQAIGAKVKATNPQQNVTYLSADRFMRQYMDAKVSNTITGFMRFYQGVNLLILDDIQELCGKQGTADVFFQIFDHLLRNGSQVVLASDQKPADLNGLPERLLSRFKAGMVAQVCTPDRETRLGIVRAKAGAEGLSLPEDVVQFVASNISGNARELQGALVSLLAHATLDHTDVTLDLAQQVVLDLVGRPKQEVITKETVVKAVCDYFKIDPDSMKQNSRKREIVLARQIAMFLCKKLTTDTTTTIGMSLGNKNHSTVVYACRAVESQIETDSNVAEAVEAIESQLKV